MYHSGAKGRDEARKYPDTSSLDSLEAELGLYVEEESTTVTLQRALLQKINAERTGNHSKTTPASRLHKPHALSRSLQSRSTTDIESKEGSLDSFPCSHKSHEQLRASCSSAINPNVKLTVDMENIVIEHDACANVGNAENYQPSSKRSLGTPAPVVVPSTPSDIAFGDRVERLRNGSTVRIRGTRHVYEEILHGTTKIVKCIHCESFLQVGKKTTSVFCPVCCQISKVGSKDHSISSCYDHEIATNMQLQEYHASRLSREANPKKDDS